MAISSSDIDVSTSVLEVASSILVDTAPLEEDAASIMLDVNTDVSVELDWLKRRAFISSTRPESEKVSLSMYSVRVGLYYIYRKLDKTNL